jgi:phage antirepressor YoqD-like protein
MTGYNTELRIKVNRRWAELEAKQHQIPATYSEALMLAAKQAEKLELQQSQIKELEPKAEFYDTVTDSKTAIDIGKAAKVLDIGIGRNKLFQKLRDKGVLMNNNIPYQTFIDRGYFRIIETKYVKPDGSTHIQFVIKNNCCTLAVQNNKVR